jgi:hypothetical protein
MRAPAILLASALAASPGGAAIAQGDPNLRTKLAALEKLCASGVITQADCVERRAALLGAAAPPPAAAAAEAGAGQMFRDPQGRFSAPLPDQWNASSDNGVARLSSGQNWVMLIPSPDATAEQAATDVIGQIRQQYRSLDQANSGRPNINGHAAVYASFRGVNGNGVPLAVMVAAIQAAPGHALVFVSAAPLDGIDAVSPQFLEILNGIRFTGE